MFKFTAQVVFLFFIELWNLASQETLSTTENIPESTAIDINLGIIKSKRRSVIIWGNYLLLYVWIRYIWVVRGR